MRMSSPLRYPGGKSALAGLLQDVRNLNEFGNRAIAEPFGGGAGASLSLLYLEETPKLYINDADPAIHDFWWSIANRSEEFGGLIDKTRVNMAEWRRQRATYRATRRISRLRRGFAAFYLNRCNRSGIIVNGGPIGGVRQTGKWKLDARFNRKDLRARCDKVAEYSSRIDISGDDGIQFIQRLDSTEMFLFIDPPYFEKGPTLYLNALDAKYHERLAECLKTTKRASWVLTYDDCPEVRKLYRGWATIRPFSLRYAAAERRCGTELLITPKEIRLPRQQASEAIVW
jgi:DNA adenine methylase